MFAAEEVQENIEEKVDLITKYLEKITDWGVEFGSSLLVAVLVYLVIGWIFGRVVKVIELGMNRKKVEVTLHKFLVSIFSITFKAIQIIIFASMIGVETASLIAMLGAAGLAVGLALQGSLANFAGGILVLMFRPFKAGDYIEAQGVAGEVVEIQIFNTIMRTIDNQRVIIPNGMLSNGIVKNVFAEPTRRVDLIFGISYGDDIPKVKEILQRILEADERVLKSPAIDIWVGQHADSSINMYARPWVRSDDYWEVYFDMMERVKLAFDEEGVTIPFPQRDVHMIPAE
ncbi:mechanosensitive ion channel family protein [Thalassotalea agarivorans]|uniref:Small-conductance mechanosensitive channel n=1 Tax=Thalassotalea agarivorans TaxID=349064 RepID=A0A1I0CDR2_THASX|nr:mechanosensitive ion channel domain-containing protein [Thalassotalea agarivorans]SET17240.1 small conductance mechanosensitive channel [Thalassotalea agarivorans]